MSEPMQDCDATYRRLGDADELLIKQLQLDKSSATSDLFKRLITSEKYENRLREIKSFQTSVQSRGSKTAEKSLFYHFTFNNEEFHFKAGDMKEMAEAAQMANPTTVRFNSDGSTVEFFEWKRDTAPQLDVVLDTYFNKFYTGHFMTHQGKLSFFIEGEEYYWIGSFVCLFLHLHFDSFTFSISISFLQRNVEAGSGASDGIKMSFIK